MAQKVFKGFMQVTEGTFTGETGYIYFVRKTSNTGATDGYLQFNGKKYGTAAELEADVNAKIGTLPEGYSNVVDFVNGQLSAVTDNFSSEAITGSSNGVEVEIGQADGNVTAVTVTAPDFANTYADKSDFEAVSGAVSTIQSDYLDSTDKTELENSITAETAAREALEDRVDDLEAVSADTRLDTLEAVSADTRLGDLEAISADTRLDALEEDTHTHDNKTVLDGITQAKVDQWDGMSSGASVVLSAYAGSDAGLTDGFLKTYEIFQGGVSVGKIDIPKDMVVTSGVITANTNDEKVLRLTIANQTEPVDIPVADLVDVYTPGNGIEISNTNEVSAKVVEANGLSVDSNGIAVSLADANSAGTMSAADFTKLGTIEASAQTNVIETVKVDGTALTITDKAVNIELPDYSETYAPLSLTGTVSDNRTAFDNYTAATDTRLDTIESGYTQSATFDAYTAATDASISSADTRLATIESGYTQSATFGAYTAATDASISSADTRLATIESGYTQSATFDAYTAATDASISSADTRIATIESGYTQSATFDAYTAATDDRLDALEAISADTRLDALEALSADTSSALQSVSAGDASVTVGTKDSNNDQTVAVNVSSTANNALSVDANGLFAAIYYDGDDSN